MAQAFYGNCHLIYNVTIPNNVTSIGNGAFNGCWSLQNIVIPSGVTSIDSSAFSYCYATQYFDFSNCTAVPTLANSNAFSQTTGTIIVPDNLYATWTTATNWSSLASRIVKASEV